MGILEFADQIAPKEDEKERSKSGLLAFADKVAPEEKAKAAPVQATPAKSGGSKIVAFADKLIPPGMDTAAGQLDALLKTVPEPQPEGYTDWTPKRPEPKQPMGWGEVMARGAAPMTGGAAAYTPEEMEAKQRIDLILSKAALSPVTLGFSDKLYGEAGTPETPLEKTLAGATKFAGFMATPVKVGGLVAKAATSGFGKGIVGTGAKYLTEHALSLGTAGVLSELANIKSGKQALDTFKSNALIGTIFGLTGLAHFTKHPAVSQMIRQVGGRALLGLPTDPAAWDKENIGQTVFHELMNTYFLSKGTTAAKVFEGALDYNAAKAMVRELKAPPAEVKAAGGPISWMRKFFTEADAASREPSVLFSQERQKEELPGMAEPEPMVKTTAEAEAGPGRKWTTDPGTIPGEPTHFLGDPETARVAIVPLERGEHTIFEVVSADGQSLGKFQTLRAAAQSAESWASENPVAPEFRLTNEPEKPAPFKPEALAGRQGVLPMPDASPLFKGAEAEPAKKGPDTLFSTREWNAHKWMPDRTAEAEQSQWGRDEFTERMERGKEEAALDRHLGRTEENRPQFSKEHRQSVTLARHAIEDIESGRIIFSDLPRKFQEAIYEAVPHDSELRLLGGDPAEREAYFQKKEAEELAAADRYRDKLIAQAAKDMPKKAPQRPVEAKSPVPPGEEAGEARIVPKSPEKPVPSEQERAPLGRAPETVDELKSEIVRINEGRVTKEMADGLGALVKGVARYLGMTPDEYVKSKFAELRGGEEAPPDMSKVYTAEERARLIKECQDRGISDRQMIDKVLNGEPIASVEFLNDGRAIVRAFRKSNIAGMAHELGHIFRRDLNANEKAIVEKALHIGRGGWDRYAEERWAKQFELYLKRGSAPNPELNGVFAKFKKWIGDIYKSSRDMFNANYRLHPEVRKVLDKMIGGKEIPPPTPRAARTKPVGRVTEPGGQRPPAPPPPGKPPSAPPGPKKPPQDGPTVDGKAGTESDPVLARLGAKGQGLKNSMVQALRDLPKVPKKLGDVIKNPIYFFEKVPFLKKYTYDVKKTADANFAKAIAKVHVDLARWRVSTRHQKDKGGERIWIYAISRQKDGMKVLEKEGITEIPDLTREELGIYNEVRQNLEDLYIRINEARQLLGLKPIGKIENYFTFLRKAPELEQLGFEPIFDPDHKAVTEASKHIADPSFFKHRGKGEQPLERNFYRVYENYVRKAIHYVENAPVVANVMLFTGGLRGGPVRFSRADGSEDAYSMMKENNHVFMELRRWANFSTGHRPVSWVKDLFEEHPRVLKTIQGINRNIATGVLSANIRSALVQPSAFRNSYIELGRRWLYEGGKTFLTKGARADIMRKSEVLWGREFDVHAAAVAEGPPGKLGKLRDLKWRIAEAGISPLKVLDMVTAQITWAGAYARATAAKANGGLGLAGKEAVQYADDIVTKTQASAAPRDIAPIQRAAEGKLLTMFQTFVINEWNYLGHKVVADAQNKSMPFSERYTAAMRLVVATALVNSIFEDLFRMRSPFPTPERALIGGILKGEKAGPIIVNTLTEPLEQLPILGGPLRWSTERRFMLPAPVQAGADLGRLFGKTKRAFAQGDFSIFQPEDLSAPFRLMGIPGVSQAEKTMRRREMGAGWPHALMGQKIEALEKKVPSVGTKAERALLKKYGLNTGARVRGPKKARRDEKRLLQKYGLK